MKRSKEIRYLCTGQQLGVSRVNDGISETAAETAENDPLDLIWADDHLGRREDARFVSDFIRGQIELRRKNGRVASYVLNVDSPWGGGKSFFLSRLAEQLRFEGHLVAEVNAWRDDHSDDPLISLMAAIEKVLDPYLKKPGKISAAWGAAKTNGVRIAGKVAVAAAKTALKRYVGESVEDLILEAEETKQKDNKTPSAKPASEDVIGTALEEATKEISSLTDRAADALIAKFNTTSKSISGFRGNMAAITKTMAEADRKAPLFVLVDELDRCRPTYAISLLERAKHLFEADGVAFIFATDAGQLQHAVRGVYGGDFDGSGYLTRFFDRRYVFAEPDVNQFVASRIVDLDLSKLDSGLEKPRETIIHGFQALQPMPLRSVEQIIEIITATISAWSSKLPIDTASLLLLSTCYHQRQDFNTNVFFESVRGRWMFTSSRNYEQQPQRIDVFGMTVNLLAQSGDLYSGVVGRSAGPNPADEYIQRYLSREFNARIAHQQGPSILLSLRSLSIR